MRQRNCVLMVACGIGLLWPAVAGATDYGVFTEGFETGWSEGEFVALNNPDWFGDPPPNEFKQPRVVSGIGVGDPPSWGITTGNKPITWLARPFSWTDSAFTEVVLGMDFQAGDSFFDDDRVGWAIEPDTTAESATFAIGMDADVIRGVWKDDGGGSVKHIMGTLTGIVPGNWYRMTASFQKLTDSSARIDATVLALAQDGTVSSEIGTYAIPDTSVLGADAPGSQFFTASEMWPQYKNRETTSGAADNIHAAILPEPASLLLLGLGVTFVTRRRRLN